MRASSGCAATASRRSRSTRWPPCAQSRSPSACARSAAPCALRSTCWTSRPSSRARTRPPAGAPAAGARVLTCCGGQARPTAVSARPMLAPVRLGCLPAHFGRPRPPLLTQRSPIYLALVRASLPSPSLRPAASSAVCSGFSNEAARPLGVGCLHRNPGNAAVRGGEEARRLAFACPPRQAGQALSPPPPRAARSTLVCETVAEARRLAFQGPERHKVVALDGTLIAKAGLITGGITGNEAARASRWDDQALDRLKAARACHTLPRCLSYPRQSRPASSFMTYRPLAMTSASLLWQCGLAWPAVVRASSRCAALRRQM